MTAAAVRDLFLALHRGPVFQEVVRRLEAERGRASLAGLAPAAKALYLALLWQALDRPLLVVTDTAKRAEELAGLIETFFDLLVTGRPAGRPQLLPALDVLPGQRLSPHSEIAEQRAVALWRMAAGRAAITVTPAASALYRLDPPEFYRQLALTLRANEEIPLDELTAYLDAMGYQQREPVEMVGDYSLRGGILDVFPPEASRPVRVEFYGDLIESLRRFDPETQRSVLKVEEAVLLPLTGQPRTRELLEQLAARLPGVPSPGDPFPGWEFLTALVRPRRAALTGFDARALVVWDEPEGLRAEADKLAARLEALATTHPLAPAANFFTFGELEEAARGQAALELRELAIGAPDGGTLEIASQPAIRFHGNMPMAVAETRSLVERGYRVAYFAPSNGEIERLADIFQEYGVPFHLGLDPSDTAPSYLAQRTYFGAGEANTFLIKGRVANGVVLPEASLALFGADNLFDTSGLVAAPARPAPKSRLAAFASDLSDLHPGDYVVHTVHGVGRFAGVRELGAGETKSDFMLLEYAGGAKLYVPLTRLDLVEKYRGAGDTRPALDKLGGVTWEKTKSRVKAKMRDMADELLKLYAQRRMAAGFAFSSDSNWQREFEDAFEFSPTHDQITAVADIKRDMETDAPMDRLLCGDVGFGKTEVAMRAAFKALGDGKQVAVLAPTTVLAFQHYETFKRRFAPFPARVELVSRFRHAKEIKAVLEDLAAGKVDVLIGTHRLLSKDVEFRDLGLLVIDEEQRFGVRHKERLKQLRQNVDVLTMSATPIPRTLHMSLIGMRDMSLIETPPKDRLAIHTVVAHFHSGLVRTAIEQELNRGGQVYFIHNRVDSIYTRAAWLQELLPQARIGIGHGQMGEDQLEKALLSFMRHECDVFVCTTIAENGLDIPLANTILIENAERYGLSELYQLRGRVGRSNRRAYAYLLIPPDTELSEVARKRLAALKEFSDLGAGFKIAALDLELRGAGNLLGGEQHGHIEAVGYDTYVRLLEETVRELKGEETPLEIRSTLTLGLDVRIPADYIQDEHQRLRVYKRLAGVKDAAAGRELLAELADRYGPVPEALELLLKFSLVKNTAERIGIESVERRAGTLHVKFHPESRVRPENLMQLVAAHNNAQFTPDGVLRLPLAGVAGAGALLGFVERQMAALDGR